MPGNITPGFPDNFRRVKLDELDGTNLSGKMELLMVSLSPSVWSEKKAGANGHSSQ